MKGTAGDPIVNLERRSRRAAAGDEEHTGIRTILRGGGIRNAHRDLRRVVVCQSDGGGCRGGVPKIDRVVGADRGDDGLGHFGSRIVEGTDRHRRRCRVGRNGNRGGQRGVVRPIGRGARPGDGEVQRGGGASGPGEDKRAGVAPAFNRIGIRCGHGNQGQAGVVVAEGHDDRVSGSGKVARGGGQLERDRFRTFGG